MAVLEGVRNAAQRAGVSYRGATDRVPDTFGEDVQMGAPVPGRQDNDMESWRAYLAENSNFDLHDDITTEMTAPDGADRLVASDESANGDPNKWLSLTRLGNWIRDNYPFKVSNITRELTHSNLGNGDKLVVSDESAPGDPNKTITVTEFSTWLRQFVGGMFNIHEIATSLPSFDDSDRVPLSDESEANDPNAYVTMGRLADHINTHQSLDNVKADIEANKDLLHDMKRSPGIITWADVNTNGSQGGIHISGQELNWSGVQALSDSDFQRQYTRLASGAYGYIRIPHNGDAKHWRLELAGTRGVSHVLISQLWNMGNSQDGSTWKYFSRYQSWLFNTGPNRVTLQVATVDTSVTTEYDGIFGGTFADDTLAIRVADEAAFLAIPNKRPLFYFTTANE